MSTTIVEVGPIPVELVNVEELSIDKRYQRAVKQWFVEEIGANWDWRLCGVLHVNERNGRKLVVDGQHRLLGARIAGVAAVPCLLMNEAAGEEPRIFVGIQEKRRPVTAAERHIALLAANPPDERAATVEHALRAAGCGIATTSNRTLTHNARACYNIVDRGGAEHLTDVFTVCREAWPFAKLPSAAFLEGLSMFLESPFKIAVNLSRLIGNLSHTTPRAIVTASHETTDTSLIAIAKELTRIYNLSVDGTRAGRSRLNVSAVDEGVVARRVQNFGDRPNRESTNNTKLQHDK